MKRISILIVITLLFTVTVGICTGNNSSETKNEIIDSNVSQVEVIYFHGKQRCPTCLAIEAETKTTVEDELAKYVEDGSLKMSVVDYSTDSGKELAKKYKVTFSSLFVVANPGQKDESVEDFTRFAFGYARSNAVMFRDELKKKILDAIE